MVLGLLVLYVLISEGVEVPPQLQQYNGLAERLAVALLYAQTGIDRAWLHSLKPVQPNADLSLDETLALADVSLDWA